MIRMKIIGADELAQDLRSFAADKKKELEQLVAEYTLLIHGEARKLAPYDTGTLRGMIQFELEGLVGKIISGAHYSPFQEFGTGERGAQTNEYGDPPEGYEYGPSAGIPAHPYLRPAFDRYKADFIRKAKRILAS